MSDTKKKSGCFGNIIKLFLVILVIWGASSVLLPKDESKAGDVSSDLLPSIRVFLDEHEEFGTPSDTQAIPDWAVGKRQRVQFDNGRNLLFYLENDKVVTVFEDRPEGGRKKIWGEYASPPTDTLKDKQREAEGAIPAYTIMQSMKLMRGGKHADVLIPSLTRDTPRETRKSIAFQLLEKEALTAVSMFSTRDACKAQYSSSFAEAHPNASEGFLGQISPETTDFVDFQ